MGELGAQLVDAMIVNGINVIVQDSLENARGLGLLARTILSENSEIANPQQIMEAGVRCVDVIELLVDAIAESKMKVEIDVKGLRQMHRELREVREALAGIREDLLGIDSEEADN